MRSNTSSISSMYKLFGLTSCDTFVKTCTVDSCVLLNIGPDQIGFVCGALMAGPCRKVGYGLLYDSLQNSFSQLPSGLLAGLLPGLLSGMVAYKN